MRLVDRYTTILILPRYRAYIALDDQVILYELPVINGDSSPLFSRTPNFRRTLQRLIRALIITTSLQHRQSNFYSTSLSVQHRTRCMKERLKMLIHLCTTHTSALHTGNFASITSSSSRSRYKMYVQPRQHGTFIYPYVSMDLCMWHAKWYKAVRDRRTHLRIVPPHLFGWPTECSAMSIDPRRIRQHIRRSVVRGGSESEPHKHGSTAGEWHHHYSEAIHQLRAKAPEIERVRCDISINARSPLHPKAYIAAYALHGTHRRRRRDERNDGTQGSIKHYMVWSAPAEYLLVIVTCPI